MHNNPHAATAIYRLRLLLIRVENRRYYGKDGAYIMDKAKVLKACLKVGALVLAGVVTALNNKLSNAEMEETVAKKVAEALANQVEES